MKSNPTASEKNAGTAKGSAHITRKTSRHRERRECEEVKLKKEKKTNTTKGRCPRRVTSRSRKGQKIMGRMPRNIRMQSRKSIEAAYAFRVESKSQSNVGREVQRPG